MIADTDWLAALTTFQKVSETVDYVISIDAVAQFINLNWNNHLRNPLSPEYQAQL